MVFLHLYYSAFTTPDLVGFKTQESLKLFSVRKKPGYLGSHGVAIDGRWVIHGQGRIQLGPRWVIQAQKSSMEEHGVAL